MKVYTPDKWVVVKFTKEGSPPHCKVLCEWGGSFTYGSSWKLSSPVVEVSVEDLGKYKEITFKCLSGSSYIVTDYLNILGMTSAGVIKELEQKGEYTLEIVPYQEVILFEENTDE